MRTDMLKEFAELLSELLPNIPLLSEEESIGRKLFWIGVDLHVPPEKHDLRPITHALANVLKEKGAIFLCRHNIELPLEGEKLILEHKNIFLSYFFQPNAYCRIDLRYGNL